MTLYRFTADPRRWLSVIKGRALDSGSRGSTRIPRQAGTVETLGAEIDARRMVLRYLPGRPPDPPALLLREERRKFRSHDTLGLTARETEIVGLVIKGETNVALVRRFTCLRAP